MKKDWKKKALIGGGLFVVIGAVIVANIIQGSGIGFSDLGAVIEVEAGTIKRASIGSDVVASGVAELAEEKRVFVDSSVKVNDVLVEENQYVHRGQQVLDLDLDSMRIQLEQEEVNLRVQELTLEKARGLDGDSVLGDYETTRLLAENDVATATLAVNDAKSDLDRKEALYKAGAISASEIDTAQKRLDDAQLVLDNARIRLANAINNEESGVDIQSANVDASQLRVEELENRLSKAEESQYAPADGYITSIGIKDGESGRPGEAALVIGNFGSLRVRAEVNEVDKNNVKVGQTVTITSDAIDERIKITGKVVSIAMVADNRDTATGKQKIFETLVSVEDAAGLAGILSPGQNVDCAINSARAENAIVCSFDMIGEEKDGKRYVFVVDSEHKKVEKRYISLGITSDLEGEVTEGLQEGDLVIVNPPLNLKDGSRIKITNQL